MSATSRLGGLAAALAVDDATLVLTSYGATEPHGRVVRSSRSGRLR